MGLNFFSRDLGIDLGTATTLVYMIGKGIVMNEPSVVAVRTNSSGHRDVLAVGEEAKKMVGRTPGGLMAIHPLKDGVISDFEATEVMMKYFIRKAIAKSRSIGFAPRAVICIPFGVTGVERRAVEEAARTAGTRDAYLLEEPMAAAIGAGLPVEEPMGSMVVDIGGGTCEVAVLSLGGIVAGRSLRIGGNHIDMAIVDYIKRMYNLVIGERTAEEIKISLSQSNNKNLQDVIEVRGRDALTGLPGSTYVSGDEIVTAMEEPIKAIISAIRQTLEQTPPDLAGDLMERGIMLTGGSARLVGFYERLKRETGMPVHIASNAIECVVMGAAAAAENFDILRGMQ